MNPLISRNPATGETIRELQQTPQEELPAIFSRAAIAQEKWAALPVRKRAKLLLDLKETLIDHLDEICDLIALENGKPKAEALMNEVMPVIDTLSFFSKVSARALHPKNIPLHLLKYRKSSVHYWPLGTVAVIAPWNYPFLLPFGQIIMALVSGNAVVFKPSEVTPLVGLKIQELCDLAGLPQDLLTAVVGDGTLGAAIIAQRPAKIFFTGSTSTGKTIMRSAAERLIPVSLELGGKDAMIILSDADLDYASSAALWGAFSNSGQMCASTERILVHESIAEEFLVRLKSKVSQLRKGSDLGVTTYEKQKAVYDLQLGEAREKGATFLSGGAFSSDRTALAPTIVTGSAIEELSIYQEETFGPVVAVTTFKSVAEAVKKANHSRYGLLASVITKNISLGEQIAKQLEVGTVTINEVAYTAGLGETPWGGLKDSGFGRTHSEDGLYEFVHCRHIHKPRSGFFVFKSFWWFPYTPFQFEVFRQLAYLYRRSWVDKAKALPLLLWNLIHFLKNEKRL